jgi:heme-degrading monooxygenase HmoA
MAHIEFVRQARRGDEMFGTIARLRLKPGTQGRMFQLLRDFESVEVDGYIGQYIYRSEESPNEYYLVVLFRDRESYMANADSPEQDGRYRQLAELFAEEPEWHDGEVVYSTAYESDIDAVYGGWESTRVA